MQKYPVGRVLWRYCNAGSSSPFGSLVKQWSLKLIAIRRVAPPESVTSRRPPTLVSGDQSV